MRPKDFQRWYQHSNMLMLANPSCLVQKRVFFYDPSICVPTPLCCFRVFECQQHLWKLEWLQSFLVRIVNVQWAVKQAQCIGNSQTKTVAMIAAFSAGVARSSRASSKMSMDTECCAKVLSRPITTVNTKTGFFLKHQQGLAWRILWTPTLQCHLSREVYMPRERASTTE